MKQKFAKNMHIINSLVSFCHYAGASDYSIRIKHEKGLAAFSIAAKIQGMDQHLLQKLRQALELKRCQEVEQNYWELGGEADPQDELTLIGMMLDEAAAQYKEDTLEITATRIE